MTSAIVKVPFYGDDMEALQDGQDVWVGIKRACENVGLDPDTQRKKLADKEWATTVIKTAVADDGKTREMLFIHLDSVPMWLATIEASRVKPGVREKLIRYQKECARVLRDHFFGRPQTFTLQEMMAAFSAIATTIQTTVTTAVSDAIRAERESAHQERTTIGRSGSGHICRNLKAISLLIAGDDKAKYRSVLSASHTDLRAALQFSGTGRGWSNLPLAKWPDARAELERMSRAAVREAKSPSSQLDLPGHNETETETETEKKPR